MRFPHMVIERCVGCSSSWPALFASATAPLGLSRTHSRNVGWQSRRWWDMLNHHMRCNAFSVLWPWLEGDCVCVVSSLLSKDAGWEGDLVDQLPYLRINIILRNLSLSLQWLKRKLLPAECTLLVRPKRYSSKFDCLLGPLALWFGLWVQYPEEQPMPANLQLYCDMHITLISIHTP